MKHFKCLFKCLLLVFFLLLTNETRANGDSLRLAEMDSVEISLLTCGPGNAVYTLYGHTAIRVNNKSLDHDIVANYGIFSIDKSFFIPLFVFGITDYTMGVNLFTDFIESYQQDGRWVKEQKLDLTRQDKAAIVEALAKNYLPENRVYRYNYFYDNCTTRARDMIVKNISSGKVDFPHPTTEGHESIQKYSYREAIHKYNAEHPWAQLGNDLLLGVKADAPLTYDQLQFLPENLMQDLTKAILIDSAGNNRRLVKSEEYIIPPTKADTVKGFKITPIHAALLLALIIIAVTIYERVTKRTLWPFDLIILLADGIAGLILFLMIFSQHPTVRLNLQILLFCPINLLLLIPIVKGLKRKYIHKWIRIWMILLLLFFLGGLLQHYAEGAYIIAAALFIRYTSKLIIKYQKI